MTAQVILMYSQTFAAFGCSVEETGNMPVTAQFQEMAPMLENCKTCRTSQQQQCQEMTFTHTKKGLCVQGSKVD